MLDLANIQGNILGGFNKDHQRLLFFAVADRDRARQWLGRLVGVIASAEETVSFNAQFRRSRARRGTEAGLPTAQWVNVALTHRGLAALGVPSEELAAFPAAFRQEWPPGPSRWVTWMTAPPRTGSVRSPGRRPRPAEGARRPGGPRRPGGTRRSDIRDSGFLVDGLAGLSGGRGCRSGDRRR